MFVSSNNLQQNIASNIKKLLGFPLPIIDRSLMDRLIPTLAGSQYGTIDTPITFTGDLNIQVIAATTVAVNSNISALFGRSGSTTDYAQLQNTAGKLTFVTDDGTVDVLKTDHLDGKLHTYNFKRVGNTVSIDFDGAEVATNTLASASTVTIELVAALFTTVISQQFNGQILSVKFTDQSGAQDVVTNYVFDSGSDLYQLPRGEGLGDDIIPSAPDTITSPWINNLDGTFSIDGSQVGSVTLWYDTLLTANKSYECIINVSERTAGGVRPEGLDFEETYFSENGLGSFAFSTATNLHFNIQADADFDGTVSFTLRQLPDSVCLLTNFATTDWNRYMQQRNIAHDAGVIGEAWVGDNEVPDGITASGRTIIDGTTITWQPSTGYDYIRFASDLVYLVSGNVTSIPSGTLLWNTGSGTTLMANSLGAFKHLAAIGLAAADIIGLPNGSGEPDIIAENVSVQKLLEVA